MQIPKNVIEKAIEGGWEPSAYELGSTALLRDFEWQIFALDPTFWQCLGKSLDWRTIKHSDLIGHETVQWNNYAHHFYDLILQGKPTEEFWQSLLTNTTTY